MILLSERHWCGKNIVVKHINKFDKIQNNKLSLWHKPKTIFFTLKELYLLKTKKGTLQKSSFLFFYSANFYLFCEDKQYVFKE